MARRNKSLILSFKALRRLIGILGMAFFMMTNIGHELVETIANLATGLAGVCVGLFPCLALDPDARLTWAAARA